MTYINIFYKLILLIIKYKIMTHVLTKNEAKHILLACEAYLSLGEGHTENRHRSEVLAKAIEQSQKFDLAKDVLVVHKIMESVKNGDFERLKYFKDTHVGEELIKDSINTQFAVEVSRIAKEIDPIDKALNDRGVDWEKSREVLASVKKEVWPSSLTMVERLGDWQRDQQNRGMH